MAITTALCTSFKVGILKADHDFTGANNVFKLALYTSSATLGASTAAYTSSNETSGTGYTAKGGALTSVTPTAPGSGTTAIVDFNDLTFADATITARGALIFNVGSGEPSVCALDFGGDKTSTNGDFTIQFPAPNASNAIIRIA